MGGEQAPRIEPRFPRKPRSLWKPNRAPTQPGEHPVTPRLMAHQGTAHPELAPHEGPDDRQHPLPGEPPPSGLTVRSELLQGSQPSCVAARRTLGPATPPVHLTFSTRPLTFPSCSAAWLQSRAEVRHWSASCRKVVTAAAMSCEGVAQMTQHQCSDLRLPIPAAVPCLSL